MSGQTLILAGPTASGKTAAALAIAAKWPAEIVSVDSALIYRGMDIGTAKPSAAERAAVPHHLIDIRDPTQRYSAAEFVRDADPAFWLTRLDALRLANRADPTGIGAFRGLCGAVGAFSYHSIDGRYGGLRVVGWVDVETEPMRCRPGAGRSGGRAAKESIPTPECQ